MLAGMKRGPSHPGVYSIRCQRDGRVYIGSSVSVGNRLFLHRWHLRKGKHHSSPLQRSWDKHGEAAFAFEVVEAISDVEQLIVREQFWMDRLRAHVRQGGFNICPAAGSPLGRRHTDEARRKISAAKKGKPINISAEGRAAQDAARKRRKGRPGKPASVEARAKMSAAHKGMPSARKGRTFGPISEETRRAISVGIKASDAYQRSILAKVGRKMKLTAKGLAAKVASAKARPWSEKARAAIAASNKRRAGLPLSLSAEGRAAKVAANKRRWDARRAASQTVP